MNTPQTQWLVAPSPKVPEWFLNAVRLYTNNAQGHYVAQMLWQRGIQDPKILPGYLDPDVYQTASPFEFGQEMKLAVKRLQQAFQAQEKVTIWGDFDADGVTSTSVLWEGFGQFFSQVTQLNYYIPNRLTESHGLNHSGIEKLAQAGTKLIVTCDTGSTNLEEIEYAQKLGIDIIVTDHHTLPEERPPVVAMINPRYFTPAHPLYHLSGVAVAYKLVEAMYQKLPYVPQQPLENLLALVAIGLIADLVELRGDCRYLAQAGIKQLQKQVNSATATRPGVTQLLELCRRNGDRPTDISFGLGPRINAVSRIHGEASFCVELLTSRDAKKCQKLAQETELANTRRKSLQKEIIQEVKRKLARVDLSTTNVIVLEDSQWQGGVLGLVAGQIAQEYGRPTILLSITEEQLSSQNHATRTQRGQTGLDMSRTCVAPQPLLRNAVVSKSKIARGSARSVNNIDLYKLVKSQEHLLHRFGGHPFAAGLSLPVENISLFREGINQQLRQESGTMTMLPTIEADLVVTVAELSKNLFDELRLLEPCGMGNPIPKLLLQNCWFTNVWHNNAKDYKGRKVQYIKTTFKLWDNSVNEGFPGVWWGHYKDEIPQNQTCDVIVELDFNTYKKCLEVRLVALRTQKKTLIDNGTQPELIIDQRNHEEEVDDIETEKSLHPLSIKHCPLSWDEIQKQYQQAIASGQPLVLAYPPPPAIASKDVWQQLVGIAKHLSRTGKTASQYQLQTKLNLSDASLELGIKALAAIGFACHENDGIYQFSWSATIMAQAETHISTFLLAVEEEQFQRQYFSQVPLSILQGVLA